MIKKHNTFMLALLFILIPFIGSGLGRIDDNLLLFKNVSEKLKAIKTISYH